MNPCHQMVKVASDIRQGRLGPICPGLPMTQASLFFLVHSNPCPKCVSVDMYRTKRSLHAKVPLANRKRAKRKSFCTTARDDVASAALEELQTELIWQFIGSSSVFNACN